MPFFATMASVLLSSFFLVSIFSLRFPNWKDSLYSQNFLRFCEISLSLRLQSEVGRIRMMPTDFGEQRKKEICRLLGKRYRSLFLLGIILILSSAVSAQVETATVSGVITHQSGGIVVGAEVLVTNADTNVTSKTISNQSGIYLITSLKPGRYRVHVAKDGFK